MVDVVVSTENLTVLGGPQELDVDFNIGANGNRGSLFFTGLENPNNLSTLQDFPSSPQIFDIFINVNSSSEDYLQAYQYVLEDGSNVWKRSFTLQNSSYSVNQVVGFSQGEGSVDVDITRLGLNSALFQNLNNSFAYFNVQATASNLNAESAPDGANLDHFPVAMSISVDDAFFDSAGLTDPADFPLKLPITLKAVEFDGSSWSSINNKDIIVYFSISYANPNQIIFNLEEETS